MKFFIIAALVLLLGSVGVVAFHEMGKSSRLGGGGRIETISRGAAVDLSSHLGGDVVVYFAADW